MYFLLNMGIFHCYVSLPEGIESFPERLGSHPFFWEPLSHQIDARGSKKRHLHPRKLLWIPKIAIFERRYILKPSFLVSMLDFGGVHI